MLWNKIALAVVGVLVLVTGLTSVVSADGGGDNSAAVNEAAATPATICATTSTTPGINALCALWLGDTLPANAKHMIGSVIERLANGGDNDDDDKPARGLGQCLDVLTEQAVNAPEAVVTRCNSLEAGALYRLCEHASTLPGGVPTSLTARCAAAEQEVQQEALARTKAACTAFVATHPAATGERAAFCSRVIAGTQTAEDLQRIQQRIEHRMERRGHEDGVPAGQQGETRREHEGHDGPTGPSTQATPSGASGGLRQSGMEAGRSAAAVAIGNTRG